MINSIELVDPCIRNQLIGIYNEYAGAAGFPMDYCEEVAGTINDRLGIPIQVGAFLLDKPRREDEELLIAYQHVFSNLNGNIVDLTAHQFNRWLNNPLPRGVIVITASSPLYGRYVEKEMLYSKNRSK